MPVASLDKLFHKGEVEVRHVKLVHSRLARAASDHLPLVVDFHLNGHGHVHATASGSHHTRVPKHDSHERDGHGHGHK